MSDLPARAGDFFGGRWTGSGEVRDVFGRSLRRMVMTFESEWSPGDAAFLFEETATLPDGSIALRRSWHVQTDGEGAYVGVESSQGGRLIAEDRRWGFVLRFDRPRVVRGPNVTNLSLRVRRSVEGLEALGWSHMMGLPLLHTRIRLRAPDEGA